jgi:hypothetical protein
VVGAGVMGALETGDCVVGPRNLDRYISCFFNNNQFMNNLFQSQLTLGIDNWQQWGRSTRNGRTGHCILASVELDSLS